MTMWSGSFRPLNWHHYPQQGGGHVSHSHENIEPGGRFRHHLPNRNWRGRDGNDPSVDIAKDADHWF